MSKPLDGKVCLVTGATRGIGKGIAVSLGAAGALVYITGRTMESFDQNNPGSLKATAAEIEDRGGRCVALQCDHGKEDEVRAVFEQIRGEQGGQLDVLVNNAYSGVTSIMENMGKPFWETGIQQWDTINLVGLRNTYLSSVLASQLMVEKGRGLIVNISSAGGLRYLFNVAYGVGKAAVDRMAADCGQELRKKNVMFVSLWPGLVSTEHMTNFITSDEHKEKRERAFKSRGGSTQDMAKALDTAESPEFVGLCIVKLMQDTNLAAKTGKVLLTADLADEYNIIDPVTGLKPTNMRSVRGLLGMAGWTTLSSYTPSFLKLPSWLVHQASNKF